MVEAALAHVIAGKTEAAYARGDLFAKRALMMEDWAAYCEPPVEDVGMVVPDDRKRQAGQMLPRRAFHCPNPLTNFLIVRTEAHTLRPSAIISGFFRTERAVVLAPCGVKDARRSEKPARPYLARFRVFGVLV